VHVRIAFDAGIHAFDAVSLSIALDALTARWLVATVDGITGRHRDDTRIDSAALTTTNARRRARANLRDASDPHETGRERMTHRSPHPFALRIAALAVMSAMLAPQSFAETADGGKRRTLRDLRAAEASERTRDTTRTSKRRQRDATQNATSTTTTDTTQSTTSTTTPAPTTSIVIEGTTTTITTTGGTAVAEVTNTGGVTATAPVSQANVRLDASSVVSETRGDDLAAMRRLFGSASMPEANGGLAPGREVTEALGITAARSINDASECGLDAAGNLAGCNRLAGNLAWMKRYGLGAHVVVGQRQSAFIATPASRWGDAEWSRYQDFADKLVRWIVAQYDGTGFADVMLEIGNEVDITGDAADLFTLANTAVPQGDASRYEHYLRIYRVWSKAAARVQAENPAKRVLAAGPAVGAQGLFLSGGLYHAQFLERVQAEGLKLDAMTLHFYGDIASGWSNVPGSNLRDQIAGIRAALDAAGRGGVPIYVSEYGPSSDTGGGPSSVINWSHEGGAWAGRFLIDALAGGAVGGSYLLMRDVFGADATGNPNVPSFTHVRDGVDHPKPGANVFRMAAMIPGTRRAATVDTGLPTVKAIGGASNDAAAMLVVNYDYDFATRSDRTTDQGVRVGFANLPFSGAVTVERWLVDRNTSNVGRYIASGSAPNPTETALSRVESFSANVTDGALALDARTLGPSAVSLWVIRKQ
jgi:hypothetical protein